MRAAVYFVVLVALALSACDSGEEEIPLRPREPQGIASTPSAGAPGRTPASPVSREGCDAAYPDVCIPSPPPDLDCGDIPHRRFKVLPPDPHRFDADGNGIGCEGG